MKCQFCCIVPHLSFVFQVLFSAMPHAFLFIPERFFVSFRASARNPVCGCFASLSMTDRSVIPNDSEESSAWMLRFAQHDKLKMANLTLLSLALQKERDVCASRQGEVNPASGCFAPLSMTSDVIPSIPFVSFRASARNPQFWYHQNRVRSETG